MVEVEVVLERKIMLKETTHLKESGHWYGQNGIPVYTTIGKNGKERPTTLRDARKANPHYVPGVTTFLNTTAKPGLELWKIKQAVLSSLTLPRIQFETDDEYIYRILKDGKEESKKAAERGTKIHAWIQQGYEGKEKELSDEGKLYYWAAKRAIDKECGIHEWKSEQPFATSKYGSKIDLICDDYVLDFKTKDVSLDGLKVYDEHKMQLVACQQGVGHKGKIGIVFVSTKDVAAKVIMCEDDGGKYLNMFNLLVEYWYAKSGLCNPHPERR